jgi:cathepsin H
MEDYPYVCGDGHCGNGTGFCKKTIAPGATVKAVVNFTEGDEKSMMAVVGVHNPVSVAFEVVPDLRHYASGVYQSTVCNSTDDSVNHAVLAVGYGNETGTPFWTIKNR